MNNKNNIKFIKKKQYYYQIEFQFSKFRIILASIASVIEIFRTNASTPTQWLNRAERFHRDDLRTANIIADDPEGVSCLVIDRETFNQLISSLDEIRTRYKDELVERRRWVRIESTPRNSIARVAKRGVIINNRVNSHRR